MKLQQQPSINQQPAYTVQIFRDKIANLALLRSQVLKGTITADLTDNRHFLLTHLKMTGILILFILFLKILPWPLIIDVTQNQPNDAVAIRKVKCQSYQQWCEGQVFMQTIHLKKLNPLQRQLRYFAKLNHAKIQQMGYNVYGSSRLNLATQILWIQIFASRNNDLYGQVIFERSGEDVEEVLLNDQPTIFLGEAHILDQASYVIRIYKRVHMYTVKEKYLQRNMQEVTQGGDYNNQNQSKQQNKGNNSQTQGNKGNNSQTQGNQKQIDLQNSTNTQINQTQVQNNQTIVTNTTQTHQASHNQTQNLTPSYNQTTPTQPSSKNQTIPQTPPKNQTIPQPLPKNQTTPQIPPKNQTIPYIPPKNQTIPQPPAPQPQQIFVQVIKQISVPLIIQLVRYSQFYTGTQLLLRYVTFLCALYVIADTSGAPLAFHLILLLTSNPLIFTQIAFPNTLSNIISSTFSSTYILYIPVFLHYTHHNLDDFKYDILAKIVKILLSIGLYVASIIRQLHQVNRTTVQIIQTLLIIAVLIPLFDYLWKLYFVRRNTILHRNILFVMLALYYFIFLFLSGYIVDSGWKKITFYVIVQTFGVFLCYLTAKPQKQKKNKEDKKVKVENSPKEQSGKETNKEAFFVSQPVLASPKKQQVQQSQQSFVEPFVRVL